MTDYLLPSGAKCRESPGSKLIAVKQCYAAGLQDRLPAGAQPVWGGTGAGDRGVTRAGNQRGYT